MGSMLAPARMQITDSSLDHQSQFNEIGKGLGVPPVPVAQATISDPTLALSDAWSVVLDVLGFYQQRLINESYIGTALEDMSLFQLARMVGYAPDRGLSATCYVYYNLDSSILREVQIPAGSKIRALPQPGEEPQTFETCTDLTARFQWNSIALSTTKSFSIEPGTKTIFVRGTSTGLKQGDLVWARQKPPGLNLGDGDGKDFYRDIYFLVDKVDAIKDLEQTKVSVVARYGQASSLHQQATQPAKSETVRDDPSGSDAYYQMQIKGRAWVEDTALSALKSSLTTAPERTVEIRGFRRRVSIFGHNAPRRLQDPRNPKSESPWLIDPDDLPRTDVLDLEGRQSDIVPGTILCIEISDRSVHGEDIEIYTVRAVQLISRTAYGMTADATRVTLDRPWKSGLKDRQGLPYEVYEEVVQKAVVHIGCVDLDVGKEPISSLDSGTDQLELDGIFLGINPGRTMLLTGDPPPGTTRKAGQEPELLTVVSVSHPPYPFSDVAKASSHVSGTTLRFNKSLKFAYDPKTVKIYGNVVKAIHGETYVEVLGSGNGAIEHQSFQLSRKPLSLRAVSTFPGAKPELTVTVADEDWECVDTLARSRHGERQFSLWTDETGASRVFFGNGRAGARLPSGRENVQARYRIGVGRIGNIGGERLKLAVDHPLGVKNVSNTRASGGADPEPISLVRSNTPLSTVALDRLVSKADFLHLAKVYPGIAKAKVRYTTVRGRQIVLASILDNGIAPLGNDSPTCTALQEAMTKGQDGGCSIFVVPGVIRPILINARIKPWAGKSWEETAAAVRETLQDVFGFWRRELGQPAHPSEALAAIQSVSSVESARLIEFRKFTPLGSQQPDSGPSIIEASEGGLDQEGAATGAELVLVQPHIPGCVVLEQDE
jgi:hypothetical protein